MSQNEQTHPLQQSPSTSKLKTCVCVFFFFKQKNDTNKNNNLSYFLCFHIIWYEIVIFSPFLFKSLTELICST